MSAIRFFIDKWYAATVAVVLPILFSYFVAAFIWRLAEPVVDMVHLAGHQLASTFLAAAVGSGISAAVTARHQRRTGKDYWVTCSRSAFSLCLVRCAGPAIPVVGAWAFYLILTSLWLGPGGYQLSAIAVLTMSFAAIPMGVALGQVIGMLVPWVLAAPVAIVSSYIGFVVVGGAGEGVWWGWLVPLFGDSLHPPVHPLWLLGETAWFAGLTLALLVLAAWLGSRPRVLSVRPAAVAAFLLLTGGIMLYLNGGDAGGDVAALSTVASSHQTTPL